MSPNNRWKICGERTLIHPVTGRQLTTTAFELTDFAPIFEVYYYGDTEERDLRLIESAPALVAENARLRAELENCTKQLARVAATDKADEVRIDMEIQAAMKACATINRPPDITGILAEIRTKAIHG